MLRAAVRAAADAAAAAAEQSLLNENGPPELDEFGRNVNLQVWRACAHPHIHTCATPPAGTCPSAGAGVTTEPRQQAPAPHLKALESCARP
eukprot:357062-Chlamydomonas_euryale.AAC.4